MYDIKVITDYEQWDRFVEASPQGTLFSSSMWCGLFNDPFSIYGCFKGQELQGGLIGFNTSAGFYSGGYPVTHFQGILLKEGLGAKYPITEALIEALPKQSTVLNSYYNNDIRPFLWNDWRPIIRYTYLIKSPDINMLEKDTRYDILHNAEEVVSGGLDDFYSLYSNTFKRKRLSVPVTRDWMQKFNELFHPVIKTTGKNSALVITDNKRAYYIFGASDGGSSSAKVIWEIIKDYPEIDMVGANSREIALYKRGFGGKLMPYLGATNV